MSLSGFSQLRSFRIKRHSNNGVESALLKIDATPVPAPRPSVEIVEEPAEEDRFRYEQRANKCIHGANSTPLNKTYPTIRVNNYEGPVKILVSCVTMNEPYRPHPYKLMGRENIGCGVLTHEAKITQRSPTVQFRNVSIQSTTKNEFPRSLQEREANGVDPFRTGFNQNTHSDISLHYLRLAFQVFVPDATGRCCMPLRSVASRIITDYKRLCIMQASHADGVAKGGTQLLLFTEKLPSKQVKVVFFEEVTGWEAPATILNVHRMFGLVITTPPYRDPGITQPVEVSYYLSRPLPDGKEELQRLCHSEPKSFVYTPVPRITATDKRLNLQLIEQDSPQMNPASLPFRDIPPSFDKQTQQELSLDDAGPSDRNLNRQQLGPLCPPMTQVPSHLALKARQLYKSSSTHLEMQALAFQEMTSQASRFTGPNYLTKNTIPSHAPIDQLYPNSTHSPIGLSSMENPILRSPIEQDCPRSADPPEGLSLGLGVQKGYDLPDLNQPPIDHCPDLSHGVLKQDAPPMRNAMDDQESENIPLEVKTPRVTTNRNPETETRHTKRPRLEQSYELPIVEDNEIKLLKLEVERIKAKLERTKKSLSRITVYV